MTKLSWLAPHPDMMMASTPKAVFKVIREDDDGYSLRCLAKGDKAEREIGRYPSKDAAKAAALRMAEEALS